VISHRELLQQLRYDPETGLFWWLLPKQGRVLSKPAGGPGPNGYIIIGIDHMGYRASRLAWFYITKRWPKGEVDHKNHDICDNRWGNLRDATVKQNRANNSLRCDNNSGIKGVSWHALRGKWRARTYINGKEKHLGLFATKEAAWVAYKAASYVEYGEFAFPANSRVSRKQHD